MLIAPANYVVIKLAAVVTGLTERAIERKIADGVWIEGREYRRGPDGRTYISIKGFEQWVETGSMSAKKASDLRSHMKELATDVLSKRKEPLSFRQPRTSNMLSA